MKVGVITFHSANNYGAILQTWALQKVLKDMGLDAGVINYHPDIIDGLYDPMKLATGWRRIAKKLTLSIKNPVSLKRYKKYKAFNRKHLKLIGDFRTYKQLADAKLNLDAYIVGSDQVWNTDHTDGFDPAYLLSFAEAKKKRISYAASIGKEYFQPRFREDFKEGFKQFTAISVREKSAVNAVQELSGQKVDVVLDPTLLLKKEDYNDIKVPSPIKEPYILVYMIEKNEQVVKLANKLSISLGLPILQRRYIPGFKNQLEPFYTADTGEFLGLMEAAEYVITNSFHGTVFSIIYKKPFISMLHTDTGSRTKDLLEDLNLESHMVKAADDFNDFSRFFISEPEKLDERIQKLREKSLDFLKKALE
jgi:polysaccharide pyruvyl transferase WcaK-like protein